MDGKVHHHAAKEVRLAYARKLVYFRQFLWSWASCEECFLRSFACVVNYRCEHPQDRFVFLALLRRRCKVFTCWHS